MARKRTWWFLGYLAALALSHLIRALPSPPGEIPAGERRLEVREATAEGLGQRAVTVAFSDSLGDAPPARTDGIPVVLLHGSPGSKNDFSGILPHLSPDRRILVPDLPGFGASSRDVSDYSIRAHARYVLQLLDRQGIEEAHFVGFSMGGGVILNIQDLAPHRVRSLSLVASIGVQELELLGDYHLNHALHALQLGGLWLLVEGTPHFGALDDLMLGVPYARNFFDTDQRPLREILQAYPGPMLIIHGRDDVLVPFSAAREHHRIVPQSELEILDKNHFFVFTEGRDLAVRLSRFFAKVEFGAARSRSQAEPLRRAAADRPFDPAAIPPFNGFSLVLVMLALAAATLVSEDLTCIGAGLLVSAGRLGLIPASVACILGIYAGDLLLYASGRWLGRKALKRRPFSWFLSSEDVERSSQWFNRKGPAIILLSRFLPGTRLPTYFAAGMFRTRFWRFSFFFLLAAVIWTPILVGLSAWLGAEARGWVDGFGRWAWLGLVGIVALVLLLTRVLLPALSYRGRRLLRGKLHRALRWEYWPPFILYPPVVAWVLWLGMRYRSPTLFTASNPAIPAGGFIGESKSQILKGLSAAGDLVARWELLPGTLSAEKKSQLAQKFLSRHGLDLPVVLKPDAGQRGEGVHILKTHEALETALKSCSGDWILQEYIEGHEFGVFYVRLPEEDRGRVFSITKKRFPEVLGDGRRTVEELILADPSLLAMARHYLRVQGSQRSVIPSAGQRHRLVELGTHCRGALFFDGQAQRTDKMEMAFETVSQTFDGFYFGRYDVRTPSLENFREGRDFKILELNGVTSEATHIYDPATSLLAAYGTLFEQWRLAFEIGRQNRANGARLTSIGSLLFQIFRYRSSE